MYEYADVRDVVDIFGVDFEVVDRFGGTAGGDRFDLGDLAAVCLDMFANAKFPCIDKRLAVFAPKRVIAGYADRLRDTVHKQVNHFRRLSLGASKPATYGRFKTSRGVNVQ